MKKERFPNVKNMNTLLSFLPEFKNTENQFYSEVENPTPFYSYKYSNLVTALEISLYQANMRRIFAWSSWSNESRKYFKTPINSRSGPNHFTEIIHHHNTR